MQKRVLEFQRCGSAFLCENPLCKVRIIMGELFARIVVFPDRGMPTEERVCLTCGRQVQKQGIGEMEKGGKTK